MERLEDVRELFFGEPIEKGHNCIKLGDHVLLLAILKRTKIDPNSARPVRKSLVKSGEAPCQIYNAPPFLVTSIGSRNGKWIKDEKIQTYFDKAS